jgi:hypothetical protein
VPKPIARFATTRGRRFAAGSPERPRPRREQGLASGPPAPRARVLARRELGRKHRLEDRPSARAAAPPRVKRPRPVQHLADQGQGPARGARIGQQSRQRRHCRRSSSITSIRNCRRISALNSASGSRSAAASMRPQPPDHLEPALVHRAAARAHVQQRPQPSPRAARQACHRPAALVRPSGPQAPCAAGFSPPCAAERRGVGIHPQRPPAASPTRRPAGTCPRPASRLPSRNASSPSTIISRQLCLHRQEGILRARRLSVPAHAAAAGSTQAMNGFFGPNRSYCSRSGCRRRSQFGAGGVTMARTAGWA